MPTEAPKVFLTCAELSGDRHAAGLARALRCRRPDIVLEGVGGAHLREAGVQVHHETVRKARMGLGAFLRAGEMLRLFRETRRRFREQGPPDLMVCCDSWTMNKHFLKIARDFGVPTMYYVSPQVWASREGRVRQMRQLVDRMAVILPFEESWLRERGLEATFVGHPLFDEMPPQPQVDAAERFPNSPPVVALIPGSRASVASKNLPGLMEVAGQIREAFPNARFVIPYVDATAGRIESWLAEHRPAWEADGILRRGEDFDALVASADVAICVSGTATLHTAALGVPLVAVYRAPRVAWGLVGWWLINTRTFALVNWLHPKREHVVPEFIPWFGDPEPVAQQVIGWLRDPAALTAQRDAQSAVVDPLRKQGASENAAAIALEMIDASLQRHQPLDV